MASIIFGSARRDDGLGLPICLPSQILALWCLIHWPWSCVAGLNALGDFDCVGLVQDQ